MPAPILPFSPNYPAQENTEPRTRTVQFGDGYTERARRGINNLPSTFSVTFSQRFADGDDRVFEAQRDADRIIEFFRERAGVKPFYFAFRNASRIHLVVATSWSNNPQPGDIYTINAEFESDYAEANYWQPIYALWPNGHVMNASLQALENLVNGPAATSAP
ncbi:MAG: hypothetical protein CMP08_07600 [Xanthomonadales bacterium]|nr:hypothetical protein [Xanthomonadales bacterium]|tara:strand:+ start:364 stop:849 length:486 start_codon:yes stop_codon:yes gene_type:complete